MIRHRAIFNLYSNVGSIDGDFDARDIDGNPVEIDNEMVEQEMQRIETETAYIDQRNISYPTIQEQLDMIYWDRINNTNNWINAISTIKNRYPKPS